MEIECGSFYCSWIIYVAGILFLFYCMHHLEFCTSAHVYLKASLYHIGSFVVVGLQSNQLVVAIVVIVEDQ